MASTIISHDDIHYKNIAKIDAIAREMGIRDKIIFIAGGTQVTPELARKAGADEGFGRAAAVSIMQPSLLNAGGKWKKRQPKRPTAKTNNITRELS